MIEIYFAPHMLADEKAFFSIALVFCIFQKEQIQYYYKKKRAVVSITKARFGILKFFLLLIKKEPE